MNPDNERLHCLVLADKVMNKPGIDPDDDLCSLARQYMRALEKIERLSNILGDVIRESDERNSPVSDYTIPEFNLEASDIWPSVTLMTEPQGAQISEENLAMRSFPVTIPEGTRIVLLIMPRNLGVHLPKTDERIPRGHSTLWAQSDFVCEWEDGAWHVCKSRSPQESIDMPGDFK